jgi:hypothetical protein
VPHIVHAAQMLPPQQSPWAQAMPGQQAWDAMPHGPTTHALPVHIPPVEQAVPLATHVLGPGSQQPVVHAPLQHGSPGPPHAAHVPFMQVPVAQA